MFKVKVITQGLTKEFWLRDALLEYEKRLTGKMHIEWVFVSKPKELIEKVLQENTFIALDVLGKQLSSEELSRTLFSKWGSRPTFVIGGSEGLSPEITRKASYHLSLSRLTFTHQMIRLILVEQLYRALEIEQNSSYHK